MSNRRSRESARKAPRFLLACFAVLACLLGALPVPPTAALEASDFLSVSSSPVSARPGTTAQVRIRVAIHPPYHVNANPPTFDYLIPMEVSFEPASGLRPGAPRYPRGHELKVGGFPEPVAVYDGTIEIVLPVRVERTAAPGPNRLPGRLRFQACDDASCYPPRTVSFEAVIEVTSPAGEQEPAPVDSITIRAPRPDTAPPSLTDSLVVAIDTPVLPENTSSLAHKGLISLVVISFLAGLALNFTPCVYPLIPITVGYFARQSSDRRRTALLATLFVFAMAVVYALVGTAAALGGSLFGRFLQNPVLLGFLAALMVAMSLAMFGLFEIRLPGRLMALTDSRPGPGGALFMGATMGLAAAPCVGPFIAALLAYVGARGNPYEGFLLFLALGFGMGTPYVPLAMIAGSLSRWPRAGAFLVVAKRVLGFILLALAAWFLLPLIGPAAFRAAVVLVMAAAGVTLFLAGVPGEGRGTFRFRKIGGAALVGIAAALLLDPPRAESPVKWEPYSRERLEAAAASGRPAIVDFGADWCLPCHELEAVTFSDPRVAEALGSFVLLKADMTGPEIAPEIERLASEKRIAGVPTVLFIGSDGAERADLRLVGFEGPEAFLGRLKALTP